MAAESVLFGTLADSKVLSRFISWIPSSNMNCQDLSHGRRNGPIGLIRLSERSVTKRWLRRENGFCLVGESPYFADVTHASRRAFDSHVSKRLTVSQCLPWTRRSRCTDKQLHLRTLILDAKVDLLASFGFHHCIHHGSNHACVYLRRRKESSITKCSCEADVTILYQHMPSLKI